MIITEVPNCRRLNIKHNFHPNWQLHLEQEIVSSDRSSWSSYDAPLKCPKCMHTFWHFREREELAVTNTKHKVVFVCQHNDHGDFSNLLKLQHALKSSFFFINIWFLSNKNTSEMPLYFFSVIWYCRPGQRVVWNKMIAHKSHHTLSRWDAFNF